MRNLKQNVLEWIIENKAKVRRKEKQQHYQIAAALVLEEILGAIKQKGLICLLTGQSDRSLKYGQNKGVSDKRIGEKQWRAEGKNRKYWQ